MSKSYLLFVLLTLLTFTCSAEATESNAIQQYQDAQSKQVLRALKNKTINIIQLGDSHTAADFMTDAIRSRLQQKLGNGGPGWSMPASITSMRLARFSYQQQGWQIFSSRSQQDQEDYTLGGVIAKPEPGATLVINSRRPEEQQTIKINLKQGPNDEDLSIIDSDGQHISIGAPIKNDQWQTTQFQARFPIKITIGMSFQTAIGGWWARNENGHGAVYSALGINGAQLDQLNRWNTNAWQQTLNNIAPDLIVLAYGTNEAYNDNLDIDAAQHILIEKIQQIRTATPHSAILIVGAPESLKNTNGRCGTRPAKLTQFQQMQRNVAATEHTFYWDWQAAMGGECSMVRWINSDLARKDGVHFTKAGYQKLGETLANALLALEA